MVMRHPHKHRNPIADDMVIVKTFLLSKAVDVQKSISKFRLFQKLTVIGTIHHTTFVTIYKIYKMSPKNL